MPKGYWIGRIDVRDEEGYKPYMAANGPIWTCPGLVDTWVKLPVLRVRAAARRPGD